MVAVAGGFFTQAIRPFPLQILENWGFFRIHGVFIPEKLKIRQKTHVRLIFEVEQF